MPASPRADFYNVADYWGDIEEALEAQGFDHGALYKNFLLNSPYLNHKEVDAYNCLAREAWKERWSEDIGWSELPAVFAGSPGQRVYRSVLLEEKRARSFAEDSSDVKVDLGSSREILDPYKKAQQLYWCGALVNEEEAFRSSLIAATDSNRYIDIIRPISDIAAKPVSSREVTRFIEAFCAYEGLSANLEVVLPKAQMVVSFDLGNELKLCYGIHEIQRRSYGAPCLRLHDLTTLVRHDQVATAYRVQLGQPWRLMPPYLWAGYGARDSSTIAFYVALTFRLKVYHLLCNAFVKFFGDVK